MKRGVAIAVILGIFVVFLFLFVDYARAAELSESYSTAIIDESLSLYVINMTPAERNVFIAEVNATLGYGVKVENIINKTLPTDAKNIIWGIVKTRQQKVIKEREIKAAEQEEEFKNSLTYRKKLFYSNLTYYLDSLGAEEKTALAREINAKYSWNLTFENIYNYFLNDADFSEVKTNISIELKLRIESLSEVIVKVDPVISLEDYISKQENGNKLIIVGENVSFSIIKSGEKNFIELESNSIKALSRIGLIIDNSYPLDGLILRANLSNSRQPALKIMPHQATQKVFGELYDLRCENCTLTLEEETIDNKIKPVYFIEKRDKVKVLFLFKRDMKVITLVDSESGEIIGERKPWWAFLAR